MAINQRLDLKQGQTLTMTPQLQQAIKLLQMSNLELNEFVEAELEKNPLLEREDGPADKNSERAEKPASENEDGGEVFDGQEEGQARTAEDFSRGDEHTSREGGVEETGRELDTNFENVFTGESHAERMNDGVQEMAAVEGGYDAFANNSFAGVGKGGSLKFDDSDYSLENTMASEANLRDHLIEQINLEFDDNKARAIALLLLDYLDENGRVEEPLGDLLGRVFKL